MARSEMAARGESKAVWSVAARLLHWITAFMILVQLAFAFFSMGPGLATTLGLPFHMSLGVSIFGLTLIRLLWLAIENPPARPASRALRWASCAAHASLYALILVIVITGWLAYKPAPFAPSARLFGVLATPVAPRFQVVSSRDVATVHVQLVYVFLVAISAHIAAALVHALVLRDGIMQGMLLGRRASHR